MAENTTNPIKKNSSPRLGLNRCRRFSRQFASFDLRGSSTHLSAAFSLRLSSLPRMTIAARMQPTKAQRRASGHSSVSMPMAQGRTSPMNEKTNKAIRAILGQFTGQSSRPLASVVSENVRAAECLQWVGSGHSRLMRGTSAFGKIKCNLERSLLAQSRGSSALDLTSFRSQISFQTSLSGLVNQRRPSEALRCAPYSHSILSNHRNALIYKRKIFLLTVKTRPSSRQNFSLLISKGNSHDLDLARFHRLSTTIGQFLAPSTMQGHYAPIRKKTVTIHSTGRSCSLRSPSPSPSSSTHWAGWLDARRRSE